MSVSVTLVKSTLVAALGGLLFGFDTAVIAGTTADLTKAFSLTSSTLGLTVSIALVGTVIGSLLAGIPGDKYGRRDSLRFMAVLYLISAVGCALAWDWYSLIFFRLIGGLGIGGSSVLGPMYIAEIAPAKLRGRLVGFFQFNIVAGILVAYFSNYLIGLAAFGLSEWRWMLGVSAIPAVFFMLMLFAIPRSPRWLASKSRTVEARTVLEQIGEPDPDGELQDIVRSIDVEHGHGTEPLFQAKYRVPLFLAISIAMFNQLSGINAILYYLNDIFLKAGFSKVSGDLQSVMIGFTNLVFTLLLIGSVGCVIALAGAATIFLSNEHENLLVWCLVLFIASFAFSQGAVIWVYISEVFPNRVRGKGQSLGSFTHWIMNAGISFLFPILAEKSRGLPFVFFAAMMALQFFIVLFFYPETKGVTLEEMQKKLGIA
jgi:SP family arabinose:H+ symporter-like MFS transporter